MEGNIKVSFWLNKTKANSAHQVPIYARVHFNYEYFTRTTGIYIKSSDWDKKAMRIKGNTEIVNANNNQLDSIKINILKIINRLSISGKPFNIQIVKDAMDGGGKSEVTLMKVVNDHLEQMQRLLGKDFTKTTIIKYTNTKLRLNQFIKFKYKRSDMFLYELDHAFISGWIDYLKVKFGNSTTTCYKHYQRFSRMLNQAVRFGYMERFPFPEYKLRMPKKRIEYLTLDEINRIEQTDFRIERLNNIRDIFIFCCYSGMAYAEVESLTPDNITRGIDGELWLHILRKKTNKDYLVPLLPKALEIIEKYKTNPQCLRKSRLLPVPSNVKYNAYLKEIADVASVKKHLTTHLARKSYASSIMLANGVNISVLSKLMGHASVQVTLDSYASVADELMLRNVKDLKIKLNSNQNKMPNNEAVESWEAKNDLMKQGMNQIMN